MTTGRSNVTLTNVGPGFELLALGAAEVAWSVALVLFWHVVFILLGPAIKLKKIVWIFKLFVYSSKVVH